MLEFGFGKCNKYSDVLKIQAVRNSSKSIVVFYVGFCGMKNGL